MKRTTSIRAAGIIATAILVMACGNRGGAEATTQPSADAGQTGESAAPAGLTGTLDVWTQPQGDDERAIKAIGKAFEEANPGVEFKLLVISEDTYATKVNTALQAKAPPDVAALEDRTWMQAGKVVQLDDKLVEWGVDVTDFNPGGIGRGTPKGTLESGLYGVGEFLGGNIFVYNKTLLEAAGVTPPPADRSLTIDEYAELCRAVAKPDPDPNKAIFGCSMPEWGPGIQNKDVFGADGRSTIGNLNSPEMVHAFDVGAGLIRDKVAPSTAVARSGQRVGPVRLGPPGHHLDRLHRDPQVRRERRRLRDRSVLRDQGRARASSTPGRRRGARSPTPRTRSSPSGSSSSSRPRPSASDRPSRPIRRCR